MLTHIHKVNDKFKIERTIYKQHIDYGTFDTKEEALAKKELLIKYNWIKNKSTGYKPEEHFKRYCIEENEQEEYIVKNRKDGKTYGAYKSRKYATIVKKIITFYEKEIKIEEIEKEAIKEFYKHISYNDLNGRYCVKYNRTTYITTTDIIEALTERDLIIKFEGNEDLMSEYSTAIYEYTREELPPFPPKYKNIIFEEKSKNKYKLRKQIRNRRIIIGNYPTYELAVLVKKYLIKNNWNKEAIKHIQRITQDIHERDKNIQLYGEKYYIRHKNYKKIIYYGKYDNIDKARYIKKRLSLNNWNKEMTEFFEYEYDKKDNINIYYYDKTDIFAKTWNTLK